MKNTSRQSQYFILLYMYVYVFKEYIMYKRRRYIKNYGLNYQEVKILILVLENLLIL